MKTSIATNKLICIFAHPDDESFGPGGTIAKLSKTSDVQIICVTDGFTPGAKNKNLSKLRLSELRKSSKILGVSKIHFLNYKDGGLCNSCYHQVATEIENILKTEKPDSLITFEPNGVTGHIDHIALSMITTFVFKKLRNIKKLYYYCIDKKISKLNKNYFVHFPEGHTRKEVDYVINTKEEWNTRVAAMKCHKSQLKDMLSILLVQKLLPKEEYFLEYKK